MGTVRARQGRGVGQQLRAPADREPADREPAGPAPSGRDLAAGRDLVAGRDPTPRRGTAPRSDLSPCNQVLLVGRVSGDPVERALPSGDPVVTWRLVVDRPPPARPGGAERRGATVDTLDCAAWTAGARRTARGLRPGDVVRVEGSLRRRFWRSGAGPASRCEVEASSVRRLLRAQR